ncbi:MAG: TonB-dependent receptor [Solimonas sp.]
MRYAYNRPRRWRFASGPLLMACAAAAFAQTAAPLPSDGTLATIPLPAAAAPPVPDAAAASDDAQQGLQEVVVTARRRTESAQDVPISMTVLDGDALDQAGLVRPQDIQYRVPNLVVSVPNTRLSSYTIRGLGSTSFNDGMESSVGLFLDGVYLGRQGLSIFDLVDLEQIEVLRGPQGTLYGKNTTAVAINITTRKPEQSFSANAEASFGDEDFRQYRGTVTGPLLDGTLAGRLTAYSTTREGTIHNVNTSGDAPPTLNNWNKQGVRGQLLWTPTAALSGRFIAEYGRQNEHCCVFLSSSDAGKLVPLRDAAVGYDRLPANPYARLVDNDADTTTRVDQRALSAQFDYAFGERQTLTSITAWRHWHYVPATDGDGSGLDITPLAGVIDDHMQFSEELRFAGSWDETLDYTAGLYYLRQHLNGLERVWFGEDAAAWNSKEAVLRNAGAAAILLEPNIDNIVWPDILAGGGRLTSGVQRDDSRAAFAQVTWHATSRLSLTPGLRYTQERKNARVVRNLVDFAGYDPPPCQGEVVLILTCMYAQQQAFDNLRTNALGGLENGEVYDYAGDMEEINWSGQLSAGCRIADDVQAYASYAQGVKAGGFNLGVVNESSKPTFEPEKAQALELGLKSRFWRRRALANLALYQTRVTDYQALTYTPGEAIATVPDNLVNGGKVRLRGIELETALRPTPHLNLRAAGAYNRAVYLEFPDAPRAPEDTPLPPAAPTFQDLRGKPLYNAPLWTATAGADYDYYSAVLANQGTGTYGVIPGDPRTWGITLRGNFE